MAQKGKQRASEEAREVDAFLKYSQAFLKWLQDNIATVLVGAAVLVVGGVGYVIYKQVSFAAEEKAQDTYFVVEKDYLDLKEKFDAAKLKLEEADEKKLKAQPADLPTGELEKDYRDILRQLEGVVEEHPGSNAAYLAATLFARIHFDHDSFEPGEKMLKMVTKKTPSSQLLYSLALDMLGTLVESQGRCEEALTSWDRVILNPAANSLLPEMLLKKALCLENLSRAAEARAVYQRLDNEFAESSAGRKAKSYLRLLDIKQGS